jgi:hypothetical protein
MLIALMGLHQAKKFINLFFTHLINNSIVALMTRFGVGQNEAKLVNMEDYKNG